MKLMFTLTITCYLNKLNVRKIVLNIACKERKKNQSQLPLNGKKKYIYIYIYIFIYIIMRAHIFA